ncbi:hypothetical protein M0R72_05880 [Candidatus Pacearchaeota archaeon]|jgi:hypothetical protein|nr:hypothetical protein [Candidatus Pacearchaeota archaeon]
MDILYAMQEGLVLLAIIVIGVVIGAGPLYYAIHHEFKDARIQNIALWVGLLWGIYVIVVCSLMEL